jgi:hypothetical protein
MSFDENTHTSASHGSSLDGSSLDKYQCVGQALVGAVKNFFTPNLKLLTKTCNQFGITVEDFITTENPVVLIKLVLDLYWLSNYWLTFTTYGDKGDLLDLLHEEFEKDPATNLFPQILSYLLSYEWKNAENLKHVIIALWDRYKVDVNYMDTEGTCPLLNTILSKYKPCDPRSFIVPDLIYVLGANPTLTDGHTKETALYVAVKRGHYKIAFFIIENADNPTEIVNIPDRNGNTPLMSLALQLTNNADVPESKKDMFAYLVHAGADLFWLNNRKQNVHSIIAQDPVLKQLLNAALAKSLSGAEVRESCPTTTILKPSPPVSLNRATSSPGRLETKPISRIEQKCKTKRDHSMLASDNCSSIVLLSQGGECADAGIKRSSRKRKLEFEFDDSNKKPRK